VGERRKKTQGGNDDGKAAGKSPRSRKARPNPKEARDLDPQASRDGLRGPDGLDGQSGPDGADTPSTASMKSTPSTASTPQEPESAPGASLPGEFCQRAGRWWWRVKLPGEGKAKARPLKLQGAKAAVEDRPSAEKIAFEMWEHALQDEAARQIKLESTEKIERLKAQFLDKVRHFTELVETANARIEMEAKARAEAEAKLAQVLQAAGPKTQNQGPQAKEAQPPAPPAAPPAPAVETILPVANPQGAMAPPPAPFTPPSPIAQVENRVPQPPAIPEVAPPAVIATSPRQKAPESETPPVAIRTGACDCCGATGIATTCLALIDSGQSLCPRCLTALHSDIARLDSDSLP
jgi:hypothetical protein